MSRLAYSHFRKVLLCAVCSKVRLYTTRDPVCRRIRHGPGLLAWSIGHPWWPQSDVLVDMGLLHLKVKSILDLRSHVHGLNSDQFCKADHGVTYPTGSTFRSAHDNEVVESGNRTFHLGETALLVPSTGPSCSVHDSRHCFLANGTCPIRRSLSMNKSLSRLHRWQGVLRVDKALCWASGSIYHPWANRSRSARRRVPGCGRLPIAVDIWKGLNRFI